MRVCAQIIVDDASPDKMARNHPTRRWNCISTAWHLSSMGVHMHIWAWYLKPLFAFAFQAPRNYAAENRKNAFDSNFKWNTNIILINEELWLWRFCLARICAHVFAFASLCDERSENHDEWNPIEIIHHNYWLLPTQCTSNACITVVLVVVALN